MKGTPGFPQCGFSGQVVQILDYLGVDYKGVNVLGTPTIRQGIKDYSNWPTIPQLYVKGEFVGGCDIVREMFQAGELQSLLRREGRAGRAGGLRSHNASGRDFRSAEHPLRTEDMTGGITRAGTLPCANG